MRFFRWRGLFSSRLTKLEKSQAATRKNYETMLSSNRDLRTRVKLLEQKVEAQTDIDLRIIEDLIETLKNIHSDINQQDYQG